MMEAYRVLKPFQWGGKHFAPKQVNAQVNYEEDDEETSAKLEPPCSCGLSILKCSNYAGDIWLVEERHPRKENMIRMHFACGDASLPPVEETEKTLVPA